ncbi:DNA-binding beta-propeller fold protein YncE [Novosphingobium chloroacetimidivorans]|uniref:DNA-binding beta-propeller fold protein YncE n=1 Tax=Novosphingobium chloroacetimidivorans TaxID=1428314 RepID=A0A7W7K9Z9_9SPHN|nr:YncE family protein [Novosphingobium chloroacetimidivorans]MBB4858941.1 DNA-binding beta-propeller fold protein YncE [Novosphingobium chloroacetimidivorans]
MRALRVLVCGLAFGAAALSITASAQEEQVIQVPGSADFLAPQGKTVWATNKGRVEQWSRKGKLAEVPVKRPCGGMAILGHDLWVANCGDGTLERIDTRTAKKVATIATGIGNQREGELNVVAGAGSVWVASQAKGMIARVDPATNQVIASIPTNEGAHYLAFGEGALWAASSKASSVQRIDFTTNAVTATVSLGKTPGFLAAGEGAVWVQEQGDGTVAVIDPTTNSLRGRVKIGPVLKYGDIDTGGGKVWLRTTEDQTFVVIDPKSLAIRAKVGKAVGSGALRYTKAGVWTSAHDVHSLSWWAKPGMIGK